MNHLDLADHRHIDIDAGEISNADITERRLSDLDGYFVNEAAYQKQRSEKGDPLIYRVHRVAAADQDGDLHYGLGELMPGTVGQEYYMTKGHFHEWRDAAEVYICLDGQGKMLLEDEQSKDVRLLSFDCDEVVYVPGHVAHRTINYGSTPLKYMGIYPAKAGHDYGRIANENFQKILVQEHDRPTLVNRTDFQNSLD